MIKIVLASFFEEENHGPGRKIGVAPSKPKDLPYNCEFMFQHLSPEQLYWDYHKNKKIDADLAAQQFTSSFKQKLNDFIISVRDAAEQDGVDVKEVLPFKDGDSLLTWEKKGNITYRTYIADCLRELGYEVEEN